jgi:2-methylcitrate dehydratase PrpD
VHPLVLELTGKKAPRTGLEGKFSVYHACAAGIVFGQAGESEFSDAVVARADVVALRGRIEAIVDTSIAEDAADVAIRCRDGNELHVFVAHAIGSLERPMSDADLRRKFHGLADPILGAGRADKLVASCAALADCSDLRALAALARP